MSAIAANISRPLALVNPTINVINVRFYSNQSPWQFLIGKWNKFYHGSEKPYPPPRDWVLEDMMRAKEWQCGDVQLAKKKFLRTKARANYVKHNARIRRLEDKLTEDAFKIQSFTNRF